MNLDAKDKMTTIVLEYSGIVSKNKRDDIVEIITRNC